MIDYASPCIHPPAARTACMLALSMSFWQTLFMPVELFLTDLKKQYEAQRAAGKDSISLDDLIKHLEENLATPLDSKYREYETALHQTNLEMFKSVIEAGLNAIKSSMLLNGGASIAMLAFIGNLAETRPNSIAILAPTLIPFALGTFCTVLTSSGRYLSQALYADEQTKWGDRFRNFCIGLSLMAHLLFLVGVIHVYLVLMRL
jgi:hypothetical protein